MPKPLQEYVQQVLAENRRGEKILQAMEFAAAAIRKVPDAGSWRRKSTRRAIFWEAAVGKLIELLAGDPGVQIVPHHDTVSFIFDDAILVRLKKASMSLRTSNYPTPQAELFHDHTADLFGYDGLQRVEAVYIPNRFDTDISWVGIVAHDGNAPIWHYELDKVVVAPATKLPAPAKTPAQNLAKLKTDKTTKRKEDGNK